MSSSAGIIIIGDEILSGRTKDTNINWIANELNDIGIKLKEARVIEDDKETIINSVKKTGRLAVVDPGWQSFGASAEIITSVIEKYSNYLKASPIRINFPDSHTPMSQNLEKKYYIDEQKIVEKIKENFKT